MNSTSGGYALLQRNDGETFLNSASNKPIYFRENNTDRMIIKSGKVGIGTSNPRVSLHVNGQIVQEAFKDEQIMNLGSPMLPAGAATMYSPHNWANSSLAYINFRSYSGSAYYNAISGTGYSFTGSHPVTIIDLDTTKDYSDKVGLIVSSTGEYNNHDKNLINYTGNITINESLPIVKISDKENDKKVFGVITSHADEQILYKDNKIVPDWENIEYDNVNHEKLRVNSVGEGAIWVTNINGNIENGDYITSSNIAGYGMKQDDDLLRNYTVGKSTMNCIFDNTQTDKYETKTVTMDDGTQYIAAFIGCTYHCG
jgi:hypothetical protein